MNEALSAWAASRSASAQVEILRQAADARGGDFLFLVSCHEIVPRRIRDLYRHTLVLHASDLPRGRGMSPHVWQILEGADAIKVTLLVAEDGLDTGDIWRQQEIAFDGTELFDEINRKIFEAELALMTWALDHSQRVEPRAQQGEPTYYRRRVPEDSRVDPTRTIEQAFDLLRVADPDRYPAFFDFRGRRYRIRLDKE
ncbi:MAG: formyltransferase family protein [Burkholderiales bacterium]